ncbi:hypothetical protein [Massilia sp. METH4]|uniref:hypothetical protein n=1 Tax=Massilia sp. METH4 TaxID=3123041 RepID=UPI0030CCE7BD
MMGPTDHDRRPTKAIFRRAVLVVMRDRLGNPEERHAQFMNGGAVAKSSTLHAWQERDPFTGRRRP